MTTMLPRYAIAPAYVRTLQSCCDRPHNVDKCFASVTLSEVWSIRLCNNFFFWSIVYAVKLMDPPDTRTTYQAPGTLYITQNLLYAEHNQGTSIYSYTPVAAVFGTTLCAYASTGTQLDCMNLSPRYEQTSIMGFLHTSACSSTVGAVPRERK